MPTLDPPAPDATISVEIKNFPVRLWWKLMETAQQRQISLSYLIFETLVEAVGYDQTGEPYDMVVAEIKQALQGD